MENSIKPYSGAHDEVIRQFEMKNKPPLSFCAKEDTLRVLVQYALKMAFNDFNFRTLHKEKSEDDKNDKVFDIKYKEWAKTSSEPSVTKYLMERLGKPFEDRFISYFTKDITKQPLSDTFFDTWHHETCQLFLNNLDGIDGNESHFKIYENLEYGKAQKIVNMMFKHLYCFPSDEDWDIKWEPYFRHCHVTLDNFTLEWFKRNVAPYQRIDSWSNLIYQKDPVGKNDYLFYQTKIRDFFEEQKKNEGIYRDVTPFQAEFYIWPEIQIHLAAESFIFALNPDKYKGKESEPTQARANIIKLSAEHLIAKVTHEIREYEKKQV